MWVGINTNGVAVVPYWVARDEGIFAKYGIDVELLQKPRSREDRLCTSPGVVRWEESACWGLGPSWRGGRPTRTITRFNMNGS